LSSPFYFEKFEIKNVYDWTYELRECKRGDEDEAIVQSRNEKIVKKINPEKRN